MKSFFILSAFALIGSCATTKPTAEIQNLKNEIHLVDSTLVVHYSKTITTKELKKHLYTYASDEFQGRKTGEEGQKLAVNFLKNYYINEGIKSPINDSTYFQTIPASYLPKGYGSSENVLAYIKGEKNPEEVIVVSAHLDHEGVKKGLVYNGADDDGSGTVAIMEIAQAFNQALKDGFRPKRSILFLHVTAEEIGLQGSQYYTENPIFALENTLANLNIDMIGRIDKFHDNNPNYVYLIGSDRLSTELHNISEQVNKSYSNLDLDYKYNDVNDKNRFYYRSDHYNFAKNNIPVIFYFNGVHDDYHKPTDTPDKIDYNLLEQRARLIFATAWQLANQDKRIIADKAN